MEKGFLFCSFHLIDIVLNSLIETVSSPDKLAGLAYGWQILIIFSVVLILVTVVAIIIKCYKQPVATSSPPTVHNEQFTAQPHRQDDPEHAGYDQPESKQKQENRLDDITLHLSTG